MKQLTLTQESVYEFIKEFLINNHCTPTNQEISTHFGWKSANAAYEHVKYIAKKGYLTLYEDGTGKYRLAKLDIKLEEISNG